MTLLYGIVQAKAGTTKILLKKSELVVGKGLPYWFLYFSAVLRIEFMASHLLNRRSTTWAMPSPLFFVCFVLVVLRLNSQLIP
jgi:hypothetical protein